MRYETIRRFIVPFFQSRMRIVSDAQELPSGSFIVASNHTDFLDGFYLAAGFLQLTGHRLLFLTKTNNYGWTRSTIPIDPDQPAAALKEAASMLTQGYALCNFVEGERNHTDTLGVGKTGTVRLALASGLPIVPVGIQGMAPHKYFFGSVGEFLRGGRRVTLRVGEPWEVPAPATVTNEALHSLTQELMQRVAPLCGKRVASASDLTPVQSS